MTKADIVEKIRETLGFSRKECILLVETVFNIVKKTLEDGETVKISGFGNFSVRQKHARRGRNPQTGEQLTIHARQVLTFKPSNGLKTRINGEMAKPGRRTYRDWRDRGLWPIIDQSAE